MCWDVLYNEHPGNRRNRHAFEKGNPCPGALKRRSYKCLAGQARSMLRGERLRGGSSMRLARALLVAQGDDGEKPRANAAYTSTLPSDFNQTLRLSLTKSLAQYYAPLEEITPQIRELLTRLDEQKH